MNIHLLLTDIWFYLFLASMLGYVGLAVLLFYGYRKLKSFVPLKGNFFEITPAAPDLSKSNLMSRLQNANNN